MKDLIERLEALSEAADDINGVIDFQIYAERSRNGFDFQPEDEFTVTLKWADIHAMDRAICAAQQALKALALRSTRPDGGWRPIETAPHGGGAEFVTDPAWVEPPEVLLLFEGNKRCVGRWDAYYGPGGAGESETRGCGWLETLTLEPVTLHIGEPTHWLPLPNPPGEKGSNSSVADSGSTAIEPKSDGLSPSDEGDAA